MEFTQFYHTHHKVISHFTTRNTVFSDIMRVYEYMPVSDFLPFALVPILSQISVVHTL
jgi:hypothetical protein